MVSLGVVDYFRGVSRGQLVAWHEPRVTWVGGEDIFSHLGGGLSPAELWRDQPHLRTVTTFVARNIAQLGLHTFERVSDTDRRRVNDGPTSFRYVDGRMTSYDLIYATVIDILLYDRAYWTVMPDSKAPSGYVIRRIPPTWVSIEESDAFSVKSYLVARDNGAVSVDAKWVLDFTGYNPTNPLAGSDTVSALRSVLEEQIEAASYRKSVWKRGGRVSAVLERPVNAPEWGRKDRERFREDWYAKFTGSGSFSGGTPILEDGMQLKRIDFNAREQQFVEAAKLSLQVVASAFHVNPMMVGQLESASYSNIREFHRMLYQDTLGPLIAQLEARINSFFLPMVGLDPERFYVEFNIAEKMQGSFEEKALAYTSAVGGPYMTRAEVRARENLPAIDGSDELIIPLNVLVGGQASPHDSAPPKTITS